MYSYPHKTAYRNLNNVCFSDYSHTLSGTGHSLYLHIPFCASKCGYCNLFSVTGADDEFMEKYSEAVIRQIKQYSELMPSDSVFDDITVGGGTPLLMKEKYLKKIFDNIYRYFNIKKDCEIITETAPGQTDKNSIVFLKNLGVTRVSMGIQSFDDNELKWLRRNHSSASAQRAAELLKKAEFKCLNFDFIYGIPFQTEESLYTSLEKALCFSPDEFFLYLLYIKHCVKLMEEKNVPDPEHVFRLYESGKKLLTDRGFYQNSMRRFSKAENTNFTECGMKSSLALGCGGRSYLGNLHVCNPYRITRCSAFEELERFIMREDYTKFKHGIVLNDDELRRRYTIKHAFIRPGISLKAYTEIFGTEFFKDFPILSEWISKGYFTEKDGLLTITETGTGLSDMLGPELISEDIKRKMAEWEQENG